MALRHLRNSLPNTELEPRDSSIILSFGTVTNGKKLVLVILEQRCFQTHFGVANITGPVHLYKQYRYKENCCQAAFLKTQQRIHQKFIRMVIDTVNNVPTHSTALRTMFCAKISKNLPWQVPCYWPQCGYHFAQSRPTKAHIDAHKRTHSRSHLNTFRLTYGDLVRYKLWINDVLLNSLEFKSRFEHSTLCYDYNIQGVRKVTIQSYKLLYSFIVLYVIVFVTI